MLEVLEIKNREKLIKNITNEHVVLQYLKNLINNLNLFMFIHSFKLFIFIYIYYMGL